MNKEIEIQDHIIQRLIELELYPYSVVFTYAVNNEGLLSITFFMPEQVKEFLNLFEYDSLCDKTGFIIIPESSTIILSGIALVKLYIGKIYEKY